MSSMEAHSNRLVHEKSPYLLQHAHNPVDWYPWGDAAFEAAQGSGKPIFLSIGYATCHWCHVMEKESFEDQEVGEILNQIFVCIKVDREELPEVDSLYMEFAQSMLSGAGGWPLNVILTPDLKPFFAATYLPKNSSTGHIGLIDVVQRIGQLWQSEEKDRVIAQSDKIVEILKRQVHSVGSELPIQDYISDTVQLLFRIADPVYGGMKGAPKFPLGYQSNLLLRYFYHTKDSRAIFLVEKTLEMMYRGGIYDHLGGGFSRYSTDEKWLIPHFEKMLYDNAILSYAYLETWKITRRPLYKQVCEKILDYILRDMTHYEGGFYSAEDADSEGSEGQFYLWSIDEIQKVAPQHSEVLCDYFGVTEEGHFEGKNVLHIASDCEALAKKYGMPYEELENCLQDGLHRLFQFRSKRVRPLRDDKIITAWNGLAIHVFAESGFALNRKEYLDAALSAARFIKNKLYKNGRLLRRFCLGDARFSPNLDDYAFLIRGLISLFEVGEGVEWLEWAIELTARLQSDFKEKGGAFYQTDGQDPRIIIRKCQFSDGAEPSGNSIHIENLLRLHQITCENAYLDQAEDALRAVFPLLSHYPLGYCYLLLALQRYFDVKKKTIVIAFDEARSHEEEIKDILRVRQGAHHVCIWKDQKDVRLVKNVPQTLEQVPYKNKTTVYLCGNGICEKPLSDIKEIQEALLSLS